MIHNNMDSLFKQMQAIAATDKPKIAEEAFVKHLLPLLVNIDNVPDLDVTVWLDIAGNPHREIDVVGKDGAVLFTVPPLLARTPTAMPSMERTGVALGEVLAIYGAKQKSDTPAAADAYLMHALRNQVIGPEQEQMLDFLKRWVDIYIRYDIPTERLLGSYTVKAEDRADKPRDPTQDLSGDLIDF